MAAVAPAKLRVGVFASSAAQPRWIAESLGRVAAADFADLRVVSIKGSDPFIPIRGSDPFVWRAYAAADRLAFGRGPDWSAPADISGLAPAEKCVAYAPQDARWRERIAALGLDVAIALDGVRDEELDGLASKGVWRHCFGDAEGTLAALAGVREVIDGSPVTASGIRIHRGNGTPDRLAYRSWSRTVPFSLARTRGPLLGKSAHFMVRALRRLHEHGDAWLAAAPAARPAREESFPGLAASVRDLTRLGARVARRTAEHCLTVGQWSLAFRFIDEEDWNASLDGFFRLEPPADRFWADPFPIQVNGRHYIFFEELPFDTGKGHISVVEVYRDGRASEPVRVLERDYHLSYPFLLEEDGKLFMIPETGFNDTVEIYRCVEFPHRWELEKVLIEGLFCVDATVHREGDRWWMFANVGSRDGVEVNDELHLFSAERLLGEWTPHPGNPVKSDVRSSRPAGGLFRRGNRLYRPGQIGAPLYGTGVALHRVTRLAANDYAEEEERRIVPGCTRSKGPEPAVLGIHTINRAADLSVTDAFVRRPRF